MIKWTLFAVAGLAGLVVLVAIIGWTLPQNHRAEGTRRIAAPPEDVWAAISDVAAYPDWRDDVTAVDLLPDDGGGVRFREHGTNGPIVFRLVRQVPPAVLVVRIDDPGQPFGGTWTYTLTPDDTPVGAGTRISIVEDGEVYNPIFRFFSRFVFSHTATLEAYLGALERRFPSTSGTTSSP